MAGEGTAPEKGEVEAGDRQGSTGSWGGKEVLIFIFPLGGNGTEAVKHVQSRRTNHLEPNWLLP